MLTLIRGIPGSGKSTLARHLVAAGVYATMHFEADMFFEKDGSYKYEQAKLPDAHGWCKEQTKQALTAGCDVIVSNTFCSLWELEPYLRMAKDAKTQVLIIECHSPFKSVHNVPQAAMDKMRSRWWPTDREAIRKEFGV